MVWMKESEKSFENNKTIFSDEFWEKAKKFDFFCSAEWFDG